MRFLVNFFTEIKRWRHFHKALGDFVEKSHSEKDPWKAKYDLQLFSLCLHNFLKDKTGLKILDAGAGQGDISELFLHYAKSLTLVELSSNACKYLKQTFGHIPNISIENKSLYEFFPSAQKYDLVVLSFVLDYLGFKEFPNRFISLLFSIQESINPDGAIFLAQPIYSVDQDSNDLLNLSVYTQIFEKWHWKPAFSVLSQSSEGYKIAFVLFKKITKTKTYSSSIV